jgi:hypothetical protein
MISCTQTRRRLGLFLSSNFHNTYSAAMVVTFMFVELWKEKEREKMGGLI